MHPDLDYASALLPDLYRVLGVSLKHFKVGHMVLLNRIESPFVFQSDDQIRGAGVKDLIVAVEICRRTYADGVRKLYSGKAGLIEKAVAMKRAFYCEREEEYFLRNATAFMEYIATAIQPPKGIWKDGKAGVTHAPEIMVKVRDLANHYGWSFEDIMEMPYRRAVFERYAILELDPTIKWKSPVERMASRQWAKNDALKREGENADN